MLENGDFMDSVGICQAYGRELAESQKREAAWNGRQRTRTGGGSMGP